MHLARVIAVPLGLATLLACKTLHRSGGQFSWPLPDIAISDSAIDREIRITQDFGLGGPGPTIRVVVDSGRTRGEVYVTHWVADPADSSGVALEKLLRHDLRKQYGCTSFVIVEDEAACRVPFRREPDWTGFVVRLDSLLATAPPAPPPTPNLVCTDGSGWEVVDRMGARVRRDASRYCGPGSPERERYERGMWSLLNAIDRTAAAR
ncbi:MAG TPA: hypothetical protein VJ825_04815 [Gemmatimonadaceae bacterium]|nr:hypothetical protein [Gemmatimonadaceae bacterium]